MYEFFWIQKGGKLPKGQHNVDIITLLYNSIVKFNSDTVKHSILHSDFDFDRGLIIEIV